MVCGDDIICIYYINGKNSNYEKQEHVFPAGLGGTAKLKKGVVSDQANELFSKYECEFMRDSIISLPRGLYGPGKRGSLSKNKKTETKISVVEGKNGLELAYIALGKPYSIFQFTRHGKCFNITVPKEDEDKYKLDRGYIKETLYNIFDPNKQLIKIKDNRIPIGDYIIGEHKDKIYIANAVGDGSLEIVKRELDLICSRMKEISDVKYEKTDSPRFNFQIKESSLSSRVYAKTAINVLAYTYGDVFVKNKCFDNIRNWILNDDYSEDEFTCYNPKCHNFRDIFPKHSHWCIITKKDDYLFAVVCFYNSIVKQVLLSNTYKEPFALQGMVCDWQNKKDYLLDVFIRQHVQNLNL